MRVRRRRFHALARANADNTDNRPDIGRCNFPDDSGGKGVKYCRKLAGSGTMHPGSGLCHTHDRKRPYDPLHRYRGIQNKRLSNQFKKLDEADRDIFDLTPEIQLMRAMMLDYVANFYEFQEAVMAWYKAEKKRPRQGFDISEASDLIEAVSRLIQRKHSIEERASISLETFRYAMEQMGIIVAKHVRDGNILNAIEAEWRGVSLDTKASTALPPVPTVEGELIEAKDGEEID